MAMYVPGATEALKRIVRAELEEMRALESALGQPSTSSGPDGSAVSTKGSAQTRTSEESSTSSSDGPDAADSTVAGAAKEAASPGPASQSRTREDAPARGARSGGGPRRSTSATAKAGVVPRPRRL